MGTMNHVAVIAFNTHKCRIAQSDSGHIHCFKYNNQTCDWGVFDLDDQESASDFVLSPLPTHYYYIDFPGDQE